MSEIDSPQPKRLIEVAFPLREVSAESAREKSIRHGHISTLHIWWARRPLAACRAAIFEALVPDPDDEHCPPAFRSLVEELVPSAYDSYDRDGPHPPLRRRLLGFVADLCKWENSNNQSLLEIARRLILEANGGAPPRVLDPFAGGGSIPLEALRLGCEAHASELNPVAVLILKCTVEYPQKYGQPESRPVPDYIHEMDSRETEAKGQQRLTDGDGSWAAAYRRNPLATDVRYWSQWVLERARNKLASYYPPDSDGAVPMAYLWARTVPCSNPACKKAIPLIGSLTIHRGKASEARLVITERDDGSLSIEVTEDTEATSLLPPAQGSKAICPRRSCQGVASDKYIKEWSWNSGFGLMPLAVVTIGSGKGRTYRAVTQADVAAYDQASHNLASLVDSSEDIVPTEPTPTNPQYSGPYLYGMNQWGKVFNDRQLLGLSGFVAVVEEASEALQGQVEDYDYAIALKCFLGLAVDRLADRMSTLCRWNTGGEKIEGSFHGNSLAFIGDFAEANPFSNASGSWQNAVNWVYKFTSREGGTGPPAEVWNGTATNLPAGDKSADAVVTDPPYYGSVPYSYLSDFFYVWLKKILASEYPDLFSTPLTAKKNEIIEDPVYDLAEVVKDDEFFRNEMLKSFREIHRVSRQDAPTVMVFAHKETEAWGALLDGLIESGLCVTASWPVHTERPGRLREIGSAALASSVFLSCRPRSPDAGVAYLHEVSEELRSRLRERLVYFWDQGIRGADFFVSAIGPALEVYSRHTEVRTTAGDPVTVKQFLELVRSEVIDYALAQVLGNGSLGAVDNETRFYVLWRWAYGALPLEAGEVITFVKPMGVELDELIRDGIVSKKGSKITLKSATDRADDEDLGLPRAGIQAPIIDGIHRCLNLWRLNKRDELADYLSTLGEARVDLLTRCAQALSEVLREDDPERRDIHAMLSGGLEPSMRRML